MNPMFAQRIGARSTTDDPEEERIRRLEAQLKSMGRSFSPEATRVRPDPTGGSDPLLSVLRLGAEMAPVTGEALSAADDTNVADARPFVDSFWDVLQRAAQRNGVSPDLAFQRFLRGTMPLGLAGMAAGSAAMRQDDQ